MIVDSMKDVDKRRIVWERIVVGRKRRKRRNEIGRDINRKRRGIRKIENKEMGLLENIVRNM